MKRSNNSDNYRDRSNNTDYVYYSARVYNNSDSD